MENTKILEGGKRGIFQVIFGRTMIIVVLLLAQFFVLFEWMFRLASYAPYLSGGVTAITGVMMLWILNTGDNPMIKLTWCIVIAMLPIFGALLYLFVRFDIGHRLEQRVIQAAIDESRVHLPDQQERLEQIRQEDKDLYNLATYLRRYSGSSLWSNTRVKYFPIGEAKWEAMLEELEQAKDFIFLEYFIVGQGRMWNSVLEILVRKAREGVDVRLMYDGTCAVTLLPYDYPKQMEKLGIKCKMFSPIRPLVSTYYNNRDHRKILVIDGHTAFTGGVNLADEYINVKKLYGHWKDTAIMLKGEAVRDFTMMFLQMWNAGDRVHDYTPYWLNEASHDTEASGYVIPYGDSPLDHENVGEMVYMSILNQAKDYVYIMTPYLILDHEMSQALQFAAKRGVDVRLILPHIPDKKYAFVLAKSHYKELLEAGVHIFEYIPGFVHAKVVVSDAVKAVVGTINLDYRSLYLHFECAAFLYKVPAISDILEDFRDTFERCQEITMDMVKKEKKLTVLMGKLLKLAAPLM
ncbi:MAG: cardiolipin synthase [Lachnospiraceae bacterium]|nr:cardiolipin synthase [Lachnospiraceae bacterium]